MLYTKDMELRNGINCIEPISNNKTKRSEAFFMPCDFQSKQKWKFEKSSDTGIGTLKNVETGECLDFSSKDFGLQVKQKKKNKMLSFLAKVVKETVEDIQAPYLSECTRSIESPLITSHAWQFIPVA